MTKIWPTEYEGYLLAEDVPEILRQARRIGAVCANHGVPLKAAALQFGLGHPAVAATLIGTSTPQQVEENVQMASLPVPAALWAELKTEGLIPQLAPTAHNGG